MELFVILTVQKQQYARGPVDYRTVYMRPTITPDATREELFHFARNQLPEDLRDAVTVFFSAEPNRFGDHQPASAEPEPAPAAV